MNDQDALELKAWRAVAGWLRNANDPEDWARTLDWECDGWNLVEANARGMDAVASASTITDLADAIAPGWREP